jgi:NADP-dependent 3-hydroxy acid dehydrogenase YdfG
MSGLQYARMVGSSVPFRAAKAAQDGFVQALTEELRPTNIRVSSIYPGHIEDTSPLEESWNAERPLGAALSDRQVVDAILFVLDMPAGTTIRSLVIERTRTEFLA